ncbi:MAG: hypothetical protein A2928_02930 [Candidatus Taylorbacteria bacterium RIFCSPLOWO2_01_FULL_45_15b]|uniref:Uncharacterized protein n=1 Tax=Candidatus Taylorbacteria bacterium RIFCSPLOWO2_01_FULL_45_15b TaxID=1802319 RepID=A0A1G2NC43_9BACT|nr:MAG: hypothetical protein A2928_02930 [Candidatus Taylorbacteria bacterium RIFCSPLOWO2_01_FULL_45_15b]
MWKTLQISVVFMFAIVLAMSSKEFAELPKVLALATGTILVAVAVGRIIRPRIMGRKIPD